jgi:hypothetical protein
MTTRAYCRCNSGHYFVGEHCPLDGWSSPASQELTRAVERLAEECRPVSLEELRKAGVSQTTFERTLVIQFGSAGSVFEAIAPEGYVVDDEWKPLRELDWTFM